MQPLGLGGTAPLLDCDPTRPKARSLRPFGPFFANVISGWTVQTNQSTANAASYKSSDLQVAKASGTATKSFTMAHSMGLVRITLGTKQVNTTYTDYVNNEATDGITNSTKITITASNAFTGNIPYSHTDGKYYFIGKKTTKPSFATSTAGIRKWNSMTPASNLSNGVYADLTASVAWANNYYYKAYAYSCRAAQQTFSAQANTTYKIECWGSKGADTEEGSAAPYVVRDRYYGGNGGYSKGYISIGSNMTLYLYTGDATAYDASDDTYDNLTYNGGSQSSSGPQWGAHGGGGTDVRLVGGEWYSFAGRKSRIIVAGGGAGGERRSLWYGDGNGGYGGGLVGGTGEVVNHDRTKGGTDWGYTLCSGGGQTSGGTSVYKDFAPSFSQPWFTGNNTAVSGAQGRFGRATFGKTHTTTTVVGLGPGGGGWYGGGSGFHAAGGGGSGFISGYSGCVAINQASSTDETHMVHKSGTNCERYDNTYYFTGFSGCYHTDSMVLAAGNQTFPSPTGSLTGSGTETGHNSTGYIIITVCPLED